MMPPSSVVESLCKQYSSATYLTIKEDLITTCTVFCTTETELVYKSAGCKIMALPPLLTTFRSLVWPSYPNNALQQHKVIDEMTEIIFTCTFIHIRP
jgi:hypothetical protein